ncbi:MAG: NUDIX hydrolase [Anaerolineae bacterium]|nr:NUDIX hydrolase [Anaerolineae bacterium]
MSDSRPIQTVSSKIDWESPYYRIRRDDIRLQDGTAGVYNVLEIHDSVFVVPVLDDGRIVLIRNYRHTLSEWVWEVPAGGIEDGQTPDEAARAELLEEAGGTAKELRFLLKASTMNGIGQHIAHLYLATGVTLGETQHETLEFINIHPMTTDEVFRLVQRGEMNDCISITALLLAQPHLQTI